MTLKGGRFHRTLAQPLAAQENRRSLTPIGYYGRMHYLESPMAGLVRNVMYSPENNKRRNSFPKFENGNLEWKDSTQLKSGSAYLLDDDGDGGLGEAQEDLSSEDGGGYNNNNKSNPKKGPQGGAGRGAKRKWSIFKQRHAWRHVELQV